MAKSLVSLRLTLVWPAGQPRSNWAWSMQRLGALAFGRQPRSEGDLLPEDEVPVGSHLCLPDGRDCRDFGVYPDREVCASPQVSAPSLSQIHHHLR